MLMVYLKCGWKNKSLKVSLWAVLTLLTYAQTVMIANAQDSWPFENPLSPLATFPLLRGEAKVIPTVVTMKKGTVSGAFSPGISSFTNFPATGTFFLDLMARIQLSRFSVRGYLEQREFGGTFQYPYLPSSSPIGVANLTYYGIRVGGDVDIFLGNRSRVGFNYDHSFYGPKVSFLGGYGPQNQQGPESGTIGCHLIYNPVWDVFGTSAIFEGWAHWPIYGTALSDFEVSGGLKWADTVLGSGSIQAGYRWTNISTQDLSGNGNLNATWGGVFGEVVYYYH